MAYSVRSLCIKFAVGKGVGYFSIGMVTYIVQFLASIGTWGGLWLFDIEPLGDEGHLGIVFLGCVIIALGIMTLYAAISKGKVGVVLTCNSTCSGLLVMAYELIV